MTCLGLHSWEVVHGLPTHTVYPVFGNLDVWKSLPCGFYFFGMPNPRVFSCVCSPTTESRRVELSPAEALAEVEERPRGGSKGIGAC